jgi:hypothetical protein
MPVIEKPVPPKDSAAPLLATFGGTGQDDTILIVRPLFPKKQGDNTLTTIYATISHGQIIPDAPVELPDGTRVTVVLSEELKSNDKEQIGLREEDWPTTPEGIAALLKRMDECEPVEMTPEDEAEWKESLTAQKEFEKANFYEDGEKLRRMWE